MLIICTQDDGIRATRRLHSAKEWGMIHRLTRGSLKQADRELANHIGAMRSSDDLCLSAHGNNTEIGDSGEDEDTEEWSWDYRDIADIIEDVKPTFRGDILISACATGVANFSARLALELEKKGLAAGSWVFGYNSGTPSEMDYPVPRDLRSPQIIKNASDLQCTRVGSGRSTRRRPRP